MDLGTIGTGLGAGFSIAGGIESAITGAQDAGAMAAIQKQEINTQEKMNVQREQAMELSSRRQGLQNIRNTQLARSMALTSATGGGAQFGSGLQGGYGTISGTGATNQLGISQNLQTGRAMFGLETQYDSEKIAMADAQAKMQKDQAFGGLLGGIGKSLGPLGSFASAIPGMFA